MNVCVCTCMCVCMWGGAHVCVHVHTCVCVCVCVYECVCMHYADTICRSIPVATVFLVGVLVYCNITMLWFSIAT